MEIIFKYSPYWILLIALLSAAATMILYYRNKRNDFRPFVIIVLSVLRFLVFMLAGVFLLSPMIKTQVKEIKKPSVILLVDNSASIIANADSGYYRNDFKTRVDELKKDLSKKYNLAYFSFGEDIKYGGDIDFSAQTTNISKAVEKADRIYRHKHTGAMIVMSDGIYNRGSNPVYSVKKLGYPVYTVALGDTTVRRDIAVKRLAVNRIAFLGDIFPVEAEVVARKCEGLTSEILFSVDGKVVEKQKVKFDKNFSRKTFRFKVKAVSTGVKKIAVSLKYVDNEFNKNNNAATAFIEVLDSRQKILITYHSPHPDIGALVRCLQTSDNYEIEEKSFEKVNNIKDYNLVILHNIPASPSEVSRLANLFSDNSIPYIMILGTQAYIQGINSLKTGVRINVRNRSYNETTPVINKDFSMFTISEEFAELIPDLPPLITPYGKYSVADNVAIPLYQRIGNITTKFPLISVTKLPGRTVTVVFGEGIWRWRLYDYGVSNNTEAFDDFFGKLVKLTGLKVKKGRFNVDFRNVYMQDEDVEFGVSLYDESYEPVTIPDVKMEIRNIDGGSEYSYVFGKDEKSYYLNAGKLNAGEYSFKVSVFFDGKNYIKTGKFVVQPVNREKFIVEANHHLLKSMSLTSGGKMYAKNEIGEIVSELENRKDIVNIEYNYLKYSDIIDVYWLLFVFVLLMATEWFLRKYNGGY